jgi:hypothetical protein
MNDSVWANSYSQEEGPAVLAGLAGNRDAGYLYHLCEGRYSIVADVPLCRNGAGQEPLCFAAAAADPIFELAADNDATFCGAWGADEEDEAAEAA